MQPTWFGSQPPSTKPVPMVWVWGDGAGRPGFDLPETEDVDEHCTGRLPKLRWRRWSGKPSSSRRCCSCGTRISSRWINPYSPTKLLPNLTRLQTFGSPSLHWVRVKVDPTSVNVFEIQPVIVRQP